MNDGGASGGESPAERLFVAVALDARARAAVARVADRLAGAGLRGRRVPETNYHATVAFLGSVRPDRKPAVLEAMRAAAAGAAPSAVYLERAGGFPSDARARVVWLGPRGGAPAFTALARDVRDRLTPLGFAFSDEAALHVTLFRLPSPEPVPPLTLCAPVAVALDALTLFASHGTRDGVRYTPVERCPLGAPARDDQLRK